MGGTGFGGIRGYAPKQKTQEIVIIHSERAVTRQIFTHKICGALTVGRAKRGSHEVTTISTFTFYVHLRNTLGVG